jgi:hypothetical protein
MSLTIKTVQIPVGSTITASQQHIDGLYMYWIRIPGVTMDLVRLDMEHRFDRIAKCTCCRLIVPEFSIQVDFEANLELPPGDICGVGHVPVGLVAVTPWLFSPLPESSTATLLVRVFTELVLVKAFEYLLLFSNRPAPRR